MEANTAATSGVVPPSSKRRVREWLLIAGLTTLSVACAKQGEGGRCDLLSGSDDCGDGLICVSLDDRNGVGAVCCPSEGDSDNPICKGNSVDLTGDAGDDSSSTVDALDGSVSSDSTILSDASASGDAAANDAGDFDASVTLNDAGTEDASTSADSTENSTSSQTATTVTDTSSLTDSSSTTDSTVTNDTSTTTDSSTVVDAGSDAG